MGQAEDSQKSGTEERVGWHNRRVWGMTYARHLLHCLLNLIEAKTAMKRCSGERDEWWRRRRAVVSAQVGYAARGTWTWSAAAKGE
jgi:hypothetical protein